MPNPQTHRPFILVIDDEPLVAAVIADTLLLVRYEVETAKNGREALEKIATRSYDLILSDLRMPELDGVGLYRELKRHAPRLLQRLIFLLPIGLTPNGTVGSVAAWAGPTSPSL